MRASEFVQESLKEACWSGYHKEGMKTMFGKRYPNCVKNKKKKANEGYDTNESQLAEIYRLAPDEYRGGKNELHPGRPEKKYYPLPGDSGLLYSIENMHDEPIIKIWDKNSPNRRDSQRTGKSIPKIIGKLQLVHPWKFPLSGALQVDRITVDEDYRSVGIAKSLYGIVLTIMKRPLLAGSNQTPGGRRNWVSLSKIPGVQMKGYISVMEDHEKIGKIIGKLGGEHIGNVGIRHFFAFDVQPNTSGTELVAVVKNKITQIYRDSDPLKYGFQSGLFALWTGKS